MSKLIEALKVIKEHCGNGVCTICSEEKPKMYEICCSFLKGTPYDWDLSDLEKDGGESE